MFYKRCDAGCYHKYEERYLLTFVRIFEDVLYPAQMLRILYTATIIFMR